MTPRVRSYKALLSSASEPDAKHLPISREPSRCQRKPPEVWLLLVIEDVTGKELSVWLIGPDRHFF